MAGGAYSARSGPSTDVSFGAPSSEARRPMPGARGGPRRSVVGYPDGRDERNGMDEPEPIELPIDGTLDLHAFRAREVKDLVADYLAACRERGILQVRIIHGKGTGALRGTVQSILGRLPEVASFGTAEEGAGGWGATIVTLRPAGERRHAGPTRNGEMTEEESLKSGRHPSDPTESLPTHSEDGVDLTLIRWMLTMTPAERLETLQEIVWSILRLRRGEAS